MSSSDEPSFDPVFDAARACPPRPRIVITASILRAMQELREGGAHPAMSWDAVPDTYARRTGRPWPEPARA